MRSILVASAVLILMSAPVAAQTLKGDELKAAFSGKSTTWQSKDGKRKGSANLTADGKASIKGNFGAFTEDTGVWRIQGDEICTKYKKMRGGKEKCYSIKRLPDGSFDNGETIIRVN